jgi:kynureninase
MEFVLAEINTQKNNSLQIITPSENRGCQISIVAHGQGKQLFDKMVENGVIPDWREPNVIRCAAVPLYNSFEDIFRFGEILQRLL